MISPETTGKRLELLKEIVPRLSRVACLGCFESPVGRAELKEVPVAAGGLSLKVQAVDVPKAGGLGAALKWSRNNRLRQSWYRIALQASTPRN